MRTCYPVRYVNVEMSGRKLAMRFKFRGDVFWGGMRTLKAMRLVTSLRE